MSDSKSESVRLLFKEYIQAVCAKFVYLETSEMGYRTDFEILIKGIFKSINVRRIDHDAKAKEGNKPDFVVLNNDVPILYIETKDVGTSLDKVEQSDQMTRYFGYTNLVLTDYLEFRFYRNGLPYSEPIKIGISDIKNRTITPAPDKYELVARTFLDFTKSQKEPIQSGKHLAKIMGGRAQRIRDNIRAFLITESEKNTELVRVYHTIKRLLVHDLTKDAFADMYAQTLVYGLFVARFHDETRENFSRGEARDLIPKSNPLLQHFFDHIVGPNFDSRLEHIVNELCEIFSHADIPELMKEYFKDDLWGKTQKGPDPVIHFYEDFLKEYDMELRKKMGAYYTPLPVVQYIVRSVDYLLAEKFGLIDGLADTSKTASGVHKVQILDPAVGTGTFISDVIGKIYTRVLQRKQEGRWPAYVHNDLLPRLHGFELMMTPYTIAHLKLAMAFKKTGFKYFNQRLGIYLTNSLERGSVQTDIFTGFGFAESIAEESKEASKIKNDQPIMVIVGNPPYSVSSTNKGIWIQDLIKVYKKDLDEKKINLDDDYIKFIRLSEHFVEKNKTGIVAMITNNSFIDGITHRQMRRHLLETFDEIYILNLHGNSKKKEKTPDGHSDENVFEIQQGVAISIFLRTKQHKNGMGTVHHHELYGKRAEKFSSLNESNFKDIEWTVLDVQKPYYFFVPKDFSKADEYEKGFKVDELFNVYSTGAESAKDDFLLRFSLAEVNSLRKFIEVHSDREISQTYDLKLEKATQVKEDFKNLLEEHTRIAYRPFDTRYTLYSSNSSGIWFRPKYEVMQHLLKPNVALLTCRQQTSFDFQHVFVANSIVERCEVSLQTGEVTYVFPLYTFAEDGSQILNLKKEIVDTINRTVGNTSPDNIFDYIYAVLHSPSYRKHYKEFLKIDFPRIPYPKNADDFYALAKFGSELRMLHLLQSPLVNQYSTSYPVSGKNLVEKIIYKQQRVYINKEQYFGDVPETAWDFFIGGYQPARKWLKDRKGHELTNADMEHYQQLIAALIQTAKVVDEIDKIHTVG